jgi:peptide-methionine (S)-S-oxide reductase
MINSLKQRLPSPEEALPDRTEALRINGHHLVLGSSMLPPFAAGLEQLCLGLGCFWGAERLFWQLPGVVTTAVGYAGGHTANPDYRDVCSGLTGHSEVVLVVWDPSRLDFDTLLRVFWEAHDPTQGLRQGNDVGSQYRSAIYTGNDNQLTQARASRDRYQQALSARGFGPITTELRSKVPFYYAEDYHQQYLAKNPDGYCGLRGTGVACPGNSTETQP